MKVQNLKLSEVLIKDTIMKKRLVVTLIIFLWMTSFQSFAQSFKAGPILTYNSVNDPAFKDAYGIGNLMIGIFLSADIVRKLELRAEINYFSVNGEMTLSEEKITYTSVPKVVGLRYRVTEMKIFCPYLGAGIDFYSYKEKVPERFGGEISGTKTGTHGEIGTYINLSNKIQFDINFRYSSAKIEILEREREIGGIKVGVGVGYRF